MIKSPNFLELERGHKARLYYSFITMLFMYGGIYEWVWVTETSSSDKRTSKLKAKDRVMKLLSD